MRSMPGVPVREQRGRVMRKSEGVSESESEFKGYRYEQG